VSDWPDQVRELAAERSEDVCEVCGMRRATHLHHRILRRYGVHTVSCALHVDDRCHYRIHHNPALAGTNGWIVVPPVDVPPGFEVDTDIRYRGAWVRLDNTGWVNLPAAAPARR
jgi:hypothetical protein